MGDNPLIWITPAAIVTVALVGAMVKWLILDRFDERTQEDRDRIHGRNPG